MSDNLIWNDCPPEPNTAASNFAAAMRRFRYTADSFSIGYLMNFQLNVYSAPWSSNAGEQALKFAQQALDSGHSVKRIFFFFDGVYHGLATQAPASDEFDFLKQWQRLADEGIELLLCIAASANRGVLNETEAERYEKNVATAANCFEITGLGQWASGFNDADRIVSFR